MGGTIYVTPSHLLPIWGGKMCICEKLRDHPMTSEPQVAGRGDTGLFCFVCFITMSAPLSRVESLNSRKSKSFVLVTFPNRVINNRYPFAEVVGGTGLLCKVSRRPFAQAE